MTMRPEIDGLEAGDRPQRCGLAAAARSQQSQELALAQAKADMIDGLGFLEGLLDVIDLEKHRGARSLHCASPVVRVRTRNWNRMTTTRIMPDCIMA